MRILGISHNRFRIDEEFKMGPVYHDNAAVLVDAGRLVSAVEDERLNRVKHSNAFPLRAIEACLQASGGMLSDIEAIVVSVAEDVGDLAATYRYLVDDPSQRFRTVRDDYADIFRRAFRADVAAKLRFCHHHLAHAWSAFGCSGQERGLTLVCDGEGDNVSTSVWIGEGKSLTQLRSYDYTKSLGGFYVNIIRLLGYGPFDEYKVMGLAPYGDASKFQHIFRRCYQLEENGEYSLAPPYEQLQMFDEYGFVERARRAGAPVTPEHRDIAAALQTALEEIILHITRYFVTQTNVRNLSMAGGVAQNCVVNGRLMLDPLLEDVFVQPASYDAGTALGAALFFSAAEDASWAPRRLTHVFYGTDIGTEESICRRLKAWEPLIVTRIEHTDDLLTVAAELLHQGKVIGWVQGQAEYGPRSLGNRSILADPRPVENRDIINRMIKKREQFRPFAPSVIEEQVSEYFVVPGGLHKLPFMTFTVPVREAFRPILGAVTHVDGTARVQTVSEQDNPRFWGLLKEFGRLSGFPILLNTSFNNNAEPIVDSVDDAVACFLTTGLDYLVIGNFVITRGVDLEVGLGGLALRLAPHRKVACGMTLDETTGDWKIVYEIQCNRTREFGASLPISQNMFNFLIESFAAGSPIVTLKMCDSLLSADGRLSAELIQLWNQRAIHLYPA